MLGLVLLSVSLLHTAKTHPVPGLFGTIIREGLTIAAWVSMWEAIANLIFEWSPHRQKMKICRRIVDAPVEFREA